jgi:hypothetical protein
MEINFLSKTKAEWFDKFARTTKSGTKYAYKIIDENGEEWLLNATEEENGSLCIITVETSEKASLLHEQLKRRSDIWNMADKQAGKLYHIISLPYLQKDQLKRKMLSSASELPEQLKSYEIIRFEEVTSKKKFQGKLVALVDKNDIGSMIKFFYYEKIYPMLEKLRGD